MAPEQPGRQAAILPPPRQPGPTIGPAVRRDLDFGPGDEFAGSLGQTQSLGNGQSVAGDALQNVPAHLPLGAVGKESLPFLGQWAILMGSQRVRRSNIVEPPR
jgi:hypothetical protein